MRIVVFLVLWLLPLLPLRAEVSRDRGAIALVQPDARYAAVLRCRHILGVVQRIGCYDAAVDGTAASETRSALSPPVEWSLVSALDPFGEVGRSMIRLSALTEVGAAETAGLSAYLLECDGRGGRRLSIRAERFLAPPGQPVSVRFRFGSGEVQQDSWPTAADGVSVSVPDAAMDFVSGLRAGEASLVEIVSYRGRRLWARFPATTGGSALFDHVLGGCQGQVTVSAAERPGGF